ncbi:hypothetical protein [Staphylococcus phage vB_StaM_SA1]|nr:hypothetical protein [Staphylococcus phage vB_StaM_SA1]
MANLSDASGIIRFEGFESDVDFLKEFKLLMHNAFDENRSQYFINFGDEPDDNGKPVISDNEEESFFAMGRWSFGNSLRNFFENISFYIIEKYKNEEDSEKIIKENLIYIKEKFDSNENMSIVFDFTDYEPGMEILLEGLVEVKPEKISEVETFNGEELILTTSILEDFSDLEVTVENLINTDLFENEDFIFPEDINFINEDVLPEPEDIGLDDNEKHEEVRKELMRQYMEDNEVYCTREFRMFKIN